MPSAPDASAYAHGAHDRDCLRAERLLHEAHVELDEVRTQERHEPDRAPVGADVAEGEAAGP
jgi:hypothetical protein